MDKDSSRLDLIKYLQNPSHFTLEDWYLSDIGGFDDIKEINADERWIYYCSEKGLLPFDDNISDEFSDDFIENHICRDLWLVVSTKNKFWVDFQFRVVFISALLSELELDENEREMIFEHLAKSGAICFRFAYFPRRIDLYPLREPSVACILFNEFSKETKEQIQWEF